MGDFNAKVGEGDETCLGHFPHGERNDRGQYLLPPTRSQKKAIPSSKRNLEEDGFGEVLTTKRRIKLTTSCV